MDEDEGGQRKEGDRTLANDQYVRTPTNRRDIDESGFGPQPEALQ